MNGGSIGGISSLAALALMAGGNQPNRGKYGKEIAKAVDYIVALSNGPMPGFLTTRASQMGGRLSIQPGPMYSHGFGTLFLSEVCGMLPNAGRDARGADRARAGGGVHHRGQEQRRRLALRAAGAVRGRSRSPSRR